MLRHLSRRAVHVGLASGIAVSVLALGPTPATAAVVGPEKQLTRNAAMQTWPELSGTRLVYSDYRHARYVGDVNDPEELVDIRVRDLRTGRDRILTPRHTATGRAAISGNRVVWNDYGNGRTTGGIWYHNLATGTHKRVPVAGGQELEISGTRICYERSNRIYVYDFATKKEKAVSPKYGSAGACDISGKVVIWQDHRNGRDFDIYSYNLGTKKETRLTTDATDQVMAKISGRHVVWQDQRNGLLNDDIYSLDLVTGVETRITTADGTQWFPNISGNRIVWMDQRNGSDSSDVYAFNLATRVEKPVNVGAWWSGNPVISGTRIVYETNRTGVLDLYLRTIS